MNFRIIQPEKIGTVNIDEIGIEYIQMNPQLQQNPSLDGSGNNLTRPFEGIIGSPFIRYSDPAYADGSSTLADRPGNLRVISNTINKDSGIRLNSLGLTDMVAVWGQFAAAEIEVALSEEGMSPNETVEIITPLDDEVPNVSIIVTRTGYVEGSDPRQQINTISPIFNASLVYGDNAIRAKALRKLDGSGQLISIFADNGEVILPYNTENLPNVNSVFPPESLFLTGTTVSNLNTTFIAMNVLLLREHNRLCTIIAEEHPDYEEETIYQSARKIVAALIQNINYSEYLPAILGTDWISVYAGYDDSINPQSTIEYLDISARLGHSMVADTIKIGAGDNTIPVVQTLFNSIYVQTNGVDGILQGAVEQIMLREINNEIVDSIRTFPVGFTNLIDLAVIDNFRGRDHGLADYNKVRAAYGLPEYNSFAQITSNTELQNKLSTIYPTVDDIDPLIGALCEDHLPGKAVGQLMFAVTKDQFQRMRDGNRFWWENDIRLTTAEKDEIRNTKLSDLLNRNTSFVSRTDVFHI